MGDYFSDRWWYFIYISVSQGLDGAEEDASSALSDTVGRGTCSDHDRMHPFIILTANILTINIF